MNTPLFQVDFKSIDTKDDKPNSSWLLFILLTVLCISADGIAGTMP